MNLVIQSLPIILLWASYNSVTALKWAAPHPITVEGDVIHVNKPTKLTCDYVKTPRENVKEVKWTYVQGGLRAPVKTANIFLMRILMYFKESSSFLDIHLQSGAGHQRRATNRHYPSIDTRIKH